jgi:hypothetical protein
VCTKLPSIFKSSVVACVGISVVFAELPMFSDVPNGLKAVVGVFPNVNTNKPSGDVFCGPGLLA